MGLEPLLVVAKAPPQLHQVLDLVGLPLVFQSLKVQVKIEVPLGYDLVGLLLMFLVLMIPLQLESLFLLPHPLVSQMELHLLDLQFQSHFLVPPLELTHQISL